MFSAREANADAVAACGTVSVHHLEVGVGRRDVVVGSALPHAPQRVHCEASELTIVQISTVVSSCFFIEETPVCKQTFFNPGVQTQLYAADSATRTYHPIRPLPDGPDHRLSPPPPLPTGRAGPGIILI